MGDHHGEIFRFPDLKVCSRAFLDEVLCERLQFLNMVCKKARIHRRDFTTFVEVLPVNAPNQRSCHQARGLVN